MFCSLTIVLASKSSSAWFGDPEVEKAKTQQSYDDIQTLTEQVGATAEIVCDYGAADANDRAYYMLIFWNDSHLKS